MNLRCFCVILKENVFVRISLAAFYLVETDDNRSDTFLEEKYRKVWLLQIKYVPLHPQNAKRIVAPVAQLVEHLTLNQGVQGSSPCGCTIIKGRFTFFFWNNKRVAPVAQLVEHLTLNQGVQGSSPCGCTRETREIADMAQLVEQRIRNAWVPGSSPGIGSRQKQILYFLGGISTSVVHGLPKPGRRVRFPYPALLHFYVRV